METYTKYGDTYPRDSKYTDIMSDYLMGPDYNASSQAEWALYRDFAIENDLSLEDMTAFMQAKDMGHHNMVLRRTPQTKKDLMIIATSMGLTLK